MSIAMSLLFGNKLFYHSFAKGEQITIGETDRANVVIPDLGLFLSVSWSEPNCCIITENDGVTTTVSAAFNEPVVISSARKIALFFSEKIDEPEVFHLDSDGEYYFGRSGKELSDGKRNDVVIDLPFVSGFHFSVKKSNGSIVVYDLGSTNGVYLNGKKILEANMFEGDIAYIMTIRIQLHDDSLLFFNVGSHFYCKKNETDNSTKVLFKRSPRIQERLPGGKIEIPSPPPKASKPEINWLATLLPAGMTSAIAIAMALAFQNTMMLLYSLPMTVAGVFVSIANYFRGSKLYKQDLKDRRNAYLKKIDDITAEIKDKREAQKKAMIMADPSPEDCLLIVKSRSAALWCREPNDADFVSVRIGTGTVPFSVTLDYTREQLLEEDELKKKPGEIFRANSIIAEMPILCNIRNSGVVGLLGTPEQTKLQLQNMILQLTTHHCYTELKLVCFCNEKDRKELAWLADLPHTHGASQDDSYIAYTQEEANKLFRLFTEQFNQRKQETQDSSSYGNDPLFIPHVLFIFFDSGMLKRSDPINQYLFMEHGLGVSCIMSAQKIAQLPKQCTEIITIEDNDGEIYNTAHASDRQSFRMDDVSKSLRGAFSSAMRPLYCDEGIAVSSLAQSYTLYQMLGINTMAQYNISEAWMASDMLTSKYAPSAPIGILENGERIFFSSPPTGDNGGAHALIAGTTGSGKSEVLLTIITSLALRYSPEEVGFLIIDFKGDSIAGKLSNLPHVRGIITSLDGNELRRSLVSISAENQKRLRIFKQYNENHAYDKSKISDIRDYTNKYRQGKVTEPLPHLFIVVDEFAEMKKQLPDVMDQFLSAAQIGRSLGIHLILATQSPSGVVDSKIRANILKQLCLKVANVGESRDMLGSDVAARIKNPGRGYLKSDDSFQLFQSAYGGDKLNLVDGSQSTQIGEAIDAIASYCKIHSVQKLPDIFCPPLPSRVVYPNYDHINCSMQSFGSLPIGIRDDPSSQFLGNYSLDIFSRNTLIVGSQLMGKTNLLQTILRDVAIMYSPEDVNIYILDFASLFLMNYEMLPHVGGVVTPHDNEKITNLFRMLNCEVEQRRQKFMSLGVSTFSAYRESGARDLPQILLIVDDLATAKAYFPLDADPLLSLCKDGLTLGISVVATAAQPVGSMSYLPTFANRIALYNNDATVYNTLLGHTALRPKEIPGRCLVSLENTVYECQSFLAFDSQREIDRAEAIHTFCKEQTAKASGKHALPIPFVPKNLTAADAYTNYPRAYENGRIMFGIDYSTVEPLSVKLAALGMLAISGNKSDVYNFQRYLLLSFEKAKDLQAEVYIIDGIERTLQPISGMSCIAEYNFMPEEAIETVLNIYKKAEERYMKVMGGDISVLDASPLLILMLNSSEAIDAVSSSKEASNALSALTGRFHSMNVCTIIGALENTPIPFGAGILKPLKDSRKLVFFDNLNNLKIVDLPYSEIKKYNGPLKKWDGYLIIGNEVTRIRVPNCPIPERK